MRFRELKLRKNPECPVCGENPTVTQLIDYQQFCGLAPQSNQEKTLKNGIPQMTVQELKQRLDAGEDLLILDVREPYEYQIANIGGTLIPQNEVPQRLAEIDRNREIVVQCRSGARSQRIAEFLAATGLPQREESRRRNSRLGRSDRPEGAKVLITHCTASDSSGAAARKNMTLNSAVLTGSHIRLEPLSPAHADGLVAASSGDPDALSNGAPCPSAATRFSATLKRRSHCAKPEPRWPSPPSAWPTASSSVRLASLILPAGNGLPVTRATAARIPTLARSATHGWHIRPFAPAANTEAKLLMLTLAFEVWQMLRVCLHTDARNMRSQAAIERIGGKFEGELRAHRLASDFIPRDSYRYSILASEWPETKRRLTARLRND